jgi:hypothetical protein
VLRQAKLDAPGTLYFECLHSGSGIEGKKILKFIQKQRSLGHWRGTEWLNGVGNFNCR